MKTKRIIALFLCVAALLTLIPSVTLASESEAEVQTVRIGRKRRHSKSRSRNNNRRKGCYPRRKFGKRL